MNNDDRCRSNNNSNNVILHGHYRLLQMHLESLLIHGMPVKTYNAPTKSHYCTIDI